MTVIINEYPDRHPFTHHDQVRVLVSVDVRPDGIGDQPEFFHEFGLRHAEKALSVVDQQEPADGHAHILGQQAHAGKKVGIAVAIHIGGAYAAGRKGLLAGNGVALS